MAAGDGLDFKQIGFLLSVGVLTVRHLVVVGVQSVGSDKERRRRHVSFDGPFKGFVDVDVGFLDYLELACLVFVKMVLGFPPCTVDLADGCIAKLDLDGLIRRVGPGRETLVQSPSHCDLVFPGFQKSLSMRSSNNKCSLKG